MKIVLKASLSLSLALAATAALASGTQPSAATVDGVAGSVSGAPSGSASFQGLSGSAATATIGYSTPSGNPPGESKFSTSGGSPAGRTFNGATGTSASGYSVSQGSSSVASGSESYYTASFTQAVADNGGPLGTSGGTYDPWDVHYGDVSGLGPSADLYFQAGLRQATSLGTTGFSLRAGETGAYGFDAYVTTGGVRQELLSFAVGPSGLIGDSYSAPSDFRIALLGASADDASATPLARLGRGVPITGAASLAQALALFVNPDGSLSRDLQFGILRSGFAAPASGGASDVLFSWHADVNAQLMPAPEPSSLAALGLGAVALLRRRRRG